MTRTAPWIAALGILCFVTEGAAKDGPTANIERGLKCYRELNYGCAIRRLVAATTDLRAGASVPAADALRAYQTLAFALASVDRHEEATAAFERCFELSPGYRLDPDVISPRIYADYLRARKGLLRAELRSTARVPPWPSVWGPPPLSDRDLRVHVPAELALMGDLGTEEPLPHRIALSAGTRLLFDEDAQAFGPGFAMALHWWFGIDDALRVGVGAMFSQHAYAGDDAKSGFPSTLYALEAGPAVSYGVRLGEYVEIDFRVMAGIGTAGLGTVGDRVGGWVAGGVGLTASPTREFALGLTVLPSVVVASLDAGGTGTSFSLPLMARLEARF